MRPFLSRCSACADGRVFIRRRQASFDGGIASAPSRYLYRFVDSLMKDRTNRGSLRARWQTDIATGHSGSAQNWQEMIRQYLVKLTHETGEIRYIRRPGPGGQAVYTVQEPLAYRFPTAAEAKKEARQYEHSAWTAEVVRSPS